MLIEIYKNERLLEWGAAYCSFQRFSHQNDGLSPVEEGMLYRPPGNTFK